MLGLLLAAIFIALNGFFVAAEFALVKVNATQLSARARRGDTRARRAKQVVSQIERYLSVTQLGITLASLGLGWVGEPAVEHIVSHAVELGIGHPPEGAVRIAVIVVAFTVLTFAHVLFGELVPKIVAIQRSEDTALVSAGPLRFIFQAFRPLLWILERATKVILRGFGLNADATSEGTLSEEEILGILVANTARSPNGKAKSHLVERVLRFAQRTSRHAMVPRVDVYSLPIGTSGVDAIDALRTHQYSRVLLTQERSLDEVIGYLYAKDVLLDSGSRDLADLTSLCRQALFVPETQSLLDVLREMQQRQIPIAVVVDEYGGTSGLVTMEDLLEEIVGEIRDELDTEPASVVPVEGEVSTWDVDASATMDELKRLGVAVIDEEVAEAVGTVVLKRLGRIPRVGDTLTIATGTTATITSVRKRRVTRVRIQGIAGRESVP